MKLSIIVPAYGEGSAIGGICEKVRQVPLIGGLEKEVVVVNDASSDNGADSSRRGVVTRGFAEDASFKA
jgi:glycosyltransferase involved in cell wall biosynthesis